MKLVVFGLTISSSWGNGHATLWRGLCRALARAGHQVTFFERDVPYYASHRDRPQPDGCTLHLYETWMDIVPAAKEALGRADAAMVTSYCPDAQWASELLLSSPRIVRAFYDMDTPMTLDALARGAPVSYLPPGGLADFDLVLSFTGGRALQALRDRLGARAVAPLYGSVDPEAHRPREPAARYRADLSYLGTYAEDRQPVLDRLFVRPARTLSARAFLLAGALYPEAIAWPANITRIEHLAPKEHPAFFCSARITLNVTRRPMAEMGYCPSGRLFEAAACCVPILSDAWEGLEQFFEPGAEILLADTTEEAISAICMDPGPLHAIAERARARTLEEHTAERRAAQLVELLRTPRTRS